MNMQPSAVMAPPPPKRMEDMHLTPVMMRDIMLKTIFRKNVSTATDIAKSVCLPVPITQ